MPRRRAPASPPRTEVAARGVVRTRRAAGGMGEFDVLRRLLPTLPQNRSVLVGPGDDCAVVRASGRTILTTDALVDGVHFQRGWLSPEEIGAKAILVNLSDVAAMGGTPQFALLSLGVPPDFAARDLEQLHRGAARVARRAGVAIAGGNLSSADRLFVSVTLVGAAARPVLRRGARAGDEIHVTGTLGDAAVAVEWLRTMIPAAARRGARVPTLDRDLRFLRQRFAAPTPRLEAGRRLATARVVSAMIDVSDGLLQDLGHICEQSAVGAVVDAATVPRSRAYARVVGDDVDAALAGGEDYELLFTVPRARRKRFGDLDLGVPVTRIGEIVAGPRGVRLRGAGGELRRPALRGFEHFRTAT